MKTSSNLSPDQTSQGWNAVVEKYEAAAGLFTSQFAKEAIRLANVNPEQRVLDVAAGTGALTLAAARLAAEVVAIDFSPAMVCRLRKRLTEENLTNASVEAMDGQAMAFPDDSFDAAFSVFGIIFFPDYAKGLREMWRVLKLEGPSVIVAWSTAERQEILKLINGALRTAVPSFPPPPRPPVWLCLSDPHIFESEMRKAGFRQVNIHTIKRAWTTPSAEWFWQYLPGLSPGL
jgi:ubiquinone/menaquinone biosynthesis C-methylase UbiE